MAVIPVIIKKEDVLAALFKGNEVLNVYYKGTNKPMVRKLMESSVEDVISTSKELENDVPNIFIELRKETPVEPPVESGGESGTETEQSPKQPEDTTNKEVE